MKRLFLSAGLLLIAVIAASAQTVSPGTPVPNFSLPGTLLTGRFYGPAVTSAPTSNAVAAANRLMATPMYMASGSVVKTMSFNITTGNASAWNARMCIYADTGTGAPGALVADSGTVAVGSGSVTGVQTATLGGGGVTIGGGWYWLAMMVDNASESLSSTGNGAGGAISSSRLLGWSSVANITTVATATGVYMAQTFGACPAAFSGSPTYGDGVALPYVVLGF